MSPPNNFGAILTWLKTASTSKNLSLLIKLIFQASLYLIWRERNCRIPCNIFRNPPQIIKEIQVLLRAKLDPLSRVSHSNASRASIMITWFELFLV